ncbi:hypothetical protein KI688_008403 [Linnemannia hyalina]|uniref:Uncharacterized protein n=1 Tax=Linnemannia hyalina TaxID=64524 RepID=A0A9P7Y170_9FUNG|nr:hypothetical protein KI688_008403 [Linnemannia hyalina]
MIILHSLLMMSLYTKYLAIASDAASSEDLDVRAIGKQMQELWEREQVALKKYWKDQEPLRKLRTRNIIVAAKDSSKLQKAVSRHQLHGNVQDATVVGFLVNESICEVLTMNLEHEAIYIPKSVGRFKLPQDRLDISALLLALGPLTAAKNIASSMVTSIKARSHLRAGKYSSLTRPSYYVFGSNVPSSGGLVKT